MEKGHGASMLSPMYLFPKISMCSQPRCSLNSLLWVLWRFHYIAMIYHITGPWFLNSVSSLSPVLGGQCGTESLTLIMQQVLMATSAHHLVTQGLSESHHIKKSIFIALTTLEIPRVVVALKLGQRQNSNSQYKSQYHNVLFLLKKEE